MKKRFKEALKEKIDASGVSIAEVSRQTKVGKHTIYKLLDPERPLASTNVDGAAKIAKYFGLTLDQFMDPDYQPVPEKVIQEIQSLPAAEMKVVEDLVASLKAKLSEDQK